MVQIIGGLGFRVWGLGFGVWGFRVSGLGFRVVQIFVSDIGWYAWRMWGAQSAK